MFNISSEPRATRNHTLTMCLLLLATQFVSALCQAEPLIDLSSDMEGVSTQAEVRYLEDAKHDYTLEQVRSEPLAAKFAPLPQGKSNFGVSSSDFWLRIDVKNSGNTPLSWYLEAIYPQWDHVSFYMDGAKPLTGGDHVAFAQRAVAAESNLYPVNTPPGVKQRIWVHFSYQLPGLAETQLRLWTPNAFYLHYAKRYFVIGGFVGIGILLVLYNLLIGYSTRMPEYIWYTSYVMAAVMSLITLTGLGYRYLWPSMTWFSDFSPLLFPLLTLLLATQFTRMFLCTRDSRFIDRVLQAVFIAGGLALLCYLFGWRDYALKLVFLCAFLTIFYPLIGLWQYRRGRLDARFYVAGWSVWSLAMLIAMLRNTAVIPSDFATSFAPALGFFIEGVLLSFALADRINRLMNEKETMELMHIEHLEQEQETLERVVLERTAALEQAMRDTEHLARTDALTGALNRRACFESGETEFDRARRYNTPLAVVMIDLDLFKSINDNYGHATGDAVLVAVVETLRGMTRTVDTIGRIGGEEFIVLLPQTSLQDAAALTERYRGAIGQLEVTLDDLAIKVTASFGVACVDVTGETLTQAIGRADAALYRAKSRGRNCIELAEGP